jgi:hypothetical protein
MNNIKTLDCDKDITNSLEELRKDININSINIKKLERKITITKNKGSLHNTDLGREIRKIKLNKNEN